MIGNKRRPVEVHKSRTPIGDERDLMSVGILYVDAWEAEAINQFVRKLETLRSSKNELNEITVTVRTGGGIVLNGYAPRSPVPIDQRAAEIAADLRAGLRCANGHTFKEGTWCDACEREQWEKHIELTPKINNGASMPEGYTLEYYSVESCYVLIGPRGQRSRLFRGADGRLYFREPAIPSVVIDEPPAAPSNRFSGIDFDE